MMKFSLVKSSCAWWIVAVAILLALMPRQAHACSCVVPGPPEEAVAQATAVFAGKAINVQHPMISRSSLDPVHITFDVAQVWKGPAFQRLAVRTAMDSASCGYGFQEGQEYIVYAYGGESDLQVSLCSRTAPLPNAAEDLAALGKGTVPTIRQPQPPSPISPLVANGGLSTLNCALPLALVSMVGVQMHRVRRRPSTK